MKALVITAVVVMTILIIILAVDIVMWRLHRKLVVPYLPADFDGFKPWETLVMLLMERRLRRRHGATEDPQATQAQGGLA